MSNNTYKFTSPNDTNKTTYTVEDVVSYVNVIDGTSSLVNSSIGTYYGNFPKKSNIAINNSNFDTLAGTIGYKINSIDLGNSFPAAVDYYNSTNLRNTFTINYGSTSPQSGYRFNSTSTNNVTIENCFNYISVILGGGGGGGAYSTSSGNNGIRGQGGGGGGCVLVDRINLSNEGRSFQVIVGCEGLPGVSSNYSSPSVYTDATDGDNSKITSNNTTLFAIANGGGGGGWVGASTTNNGLGGNSSSNFTQAAITVTPGVSNNGITVNPSNGNHPTPGGDGVLTSKNSGKNSAICASIPQTATAIGLVNNHPGIPGGGTSNITGNTTNENVVWTWGGDNPITYNYPSAARCIGGGGASDNNGGRPGHPGAPGAPGYVIIYKYLS